MGVRETLVMLRMSVSVAQLNAMLYLESVGQRFCIDFGYDNAREKAWAHWRGRSERIGRNTE